MSALVEYRLEGSVGSIVMDDGKVNALSPRMLGELGAALDRAEADRAVVLLTGREGVFSAGFDLATLGRADADALAMVRDGFELAMRLLTFPRPVVVACSGHAVAMGLFLVLSADFRVGVEGPFRLVANEVAIGLTLPEAAIELLRQRLTPAYFTRAALLAEPFSPEVAVQAGALDRVVPPAELQPAARAVAEAAAALDPDAHAATKARARRHMVSAIRAAIDADVLQLSAG